MAAAPQETNGKVEQELLENVPSTKAYKNSEFLTSPVARHIRIMCELQEPMKRLAEASIDNYIQVIGSHLLMHPEARTTQLAAIKRKIAEGGPREEMEALNAKLRFDSSLQAMDKYYVVAMEIGEKIARWSQERRAKGLPTYHISTGGGPGAMEAANRGAQKAGEMTLGMGSTRPEWGGLNKYVSPEGAFQFHYFFMRKFWSAYKCMGLVALPGGLGSLDEIFEFLALISSKKITHRLPIVLVGREHWKKCVNWEYLVESKMISQQSVDLMYMVDTADEAFAHLVSQLEHAEDSSECATVENAKRRRLCSLGKHPSDASAKGKAE